MTTCYRCEAEATSMEHVPPKCLFPEKKDGPQGKDFRKNLITVPSCDVHNTAKSKDDQYLLCVLASHLDNNEAAHHHFATKIIRSLKRDPRLAATFLKDFTRVTLNDEVTGAFKVNLRRARAVLESASYGLYFHTHGRKWHNPFKVYLLGMFMKNADGFSRHPVEEAMKELGNDLFENEEILGENPEIFFYQMHEAPEKEQLVIRMVFYGGFEVLALSNPQPADSAADTEPAAIAATS